MAIRIKVRQNETTNQLLRRFKKLCEKEGLTKEVKKRQHYEKPSERKRRERRRSFNRVVRLRGPNSTSGPGGGPGFGPTFGPGAGTGAGAGHGQRSGGGRSGPGRRVGSRPAAGRSRSRNQF